MDENRKIVIDDILEEQGKTEQEEGENIDK